jgi:prophage regulatory protein
MDSPKLLSFADLRARGVLLGRRQVDRLEAEGLFPQRVHIASNRVGWVAGEINDFVNADCLDGGEDCKCSQKERRVTGREARHKIVELFNLRCCWSQAAAAHEHSRSTCVYDAGQNM